MSKKTKRAFINVNEKAKNFKMIDCEFHTGESSRPILNSDAEGTKVLGLKVFNGLQETVQSKWFWYFVIPILVGYILILIKETY